MPLAKRYDPVAAMPPKVVTGSSRAADVQERYRRFDAAFKSNGGNATQAAITAGYSPKTAKVQGSQLLSRLNLKAAASEGERAAFENSRMSVQSVFDELANIVHFDPRRLYKNGRLIPISELPEDVAKGLASMDIDEITAGRGKAAKVIGRTTKVRQWDKMVAIDKAMKYFGMFERDNRQREQNLTIQIGLVGVPPKSEE